VLFYRAMLCNSADMLYTVPVCLSVFLGHSCIAITDADTHRRQKPNNLRLGEVSQFSGEIEVGCEKR